MFWKVVFHSITLEIPKFRNPELVKPKLVQFTANPRPVLKATLCITLFLARGYPFLTSLPPSAT